MAYFPPVPHPHAAAAWAGRRVGVLGGSFNPAHAGHRHISLYALATLRLSAVWWLVSPQNPLKAPDDMAPLAQRLRVARQVAQHPRVCVCDLEWRLNTRYTVDTLMQLRRRFPRTRFVWLMGADNLWQMSRWKHWPRLFAMVPVAVLGRPSYLSMVRALSSAAARRFACTRRRFAGSASRLAWQLPPAWAVLGNPPHPASATAIRQRAGMNATASVV